MNSPISRRKFLVGTGALAASAIVPLPISRAMNHLLASAEPGKTPAVKCHENEYWGVRSTIVAVGESACRTSRLLDIKSNPYFQAPEIIRLKDPKGCGNLICISKRLENLHWMILIVEEGDRNSSQIAASVLKRAKQAGVMLTTLVYSPPSQKPTDQSIADPIGSIPPNLSSDATIIVPYETGLECNTDEMTRFAIEDLIATYAKMGYIAIDFTDLKEIFSKGRIFHFSNGAGIGYWDAWDSALNSPHLNDGLILKANSMYINMSHTSENNGFIDLLDHLKQTLDDETDVLVCSSIDESLKDVVRISIYSNLL